MAVRYGWRPGSRIKLDAEAAGKEMERVRKSNGGALTPEVVLESARTHNSALHGHFEWDDAAAAEEYRLSQAGELIRAITVDISHSNVEPPRTVRAFVSVEREGTRSYTSTLHAMTDAELRAQVLATAWRELLALREKYAGLEELARIFAAIDEARPT